MKKLILLFATLFLFGCVQKDGVMKPGNGILKILDNEEFVEANQFTITLPVKGGVFYYSLEYEGNTANAFFKNATDISGQRLAMDVYSFALLDDAQILPGNNRWNVGRVRQTLELSAAPNDSKATRHAYVIIAATGGEAKIELIQPALSH